MVLFKEGSPEGSFVCHHCDNSLCVNPDHLYVGTHADNMTDMQRRGRSFGAQQPQRVREIARVLGKSNTWARGANNPKARLTADEVRAIAASAEQTIVLARRYHVDRTTIQRIRRNASWRVLHSQEPTND
jgi:hypothetical protein